MSKKFLVKELCGINVLSLRNVPRKFDFMELSSEILRVFSYNHNSKFFCGYGYSRLNFHSHTVSQPDLPTLLNNFL